MLGVRFIKAQPTTHMPQHCHGKMVRERMGLSFFCYTPTTSVVAVPLTSTAMPFDLQATTGDFQTVSVQGQVICRVGNPKQLATLLDLTLRTDGKYFSGDRDMLSEHVICAVQVLVQAELKKLSLLQAIGASDEMARTVKAGLVASQEITSLGLEVLGLSILAIKPAPEKAAAEEKISQNTTSRAHKITGLLHAWHHGDNQALHRLMPLVHDELRRLARHYMQREHRNHLLQTTALLNEAFIKLLDAKNIEWRDRNHFIAISANLMRRILVDYARSRGYQKRGSTFQRVDLTEKLAVPLDRNLVALDDALSALSEVDSQKARLVELKFFGGLTIEEIAKELKISSDRVKREWALAKSWLFYAMRNRGGNGSRTLAGN